MAQWPGRVRREQAANERARAGKGAPAVSLGLQGDAIQPLTLRVRQGEVETPAGVLRAPEIVKILDEDRLYLQKNGKPAGLGQVHARVNNYRKLFVRDGGRIRLRTDGDA